MLGEALAKVFAIEDDHENCLDEPCPGCGKYELVVNDLGCIWCENCDHRKA